MLSRVADSLYWMSRYMERSDGILRMLKINYASSQDDLQDFSWDSVLKLFTPTEEERARLLVDEGRWALHFMVCERENPNAVVNIVTKARENARSVQDHITKELWQCLNDFYHSVRDGGLAKSLYKEDPITILDTLVKQGLLFVGTGDITMARGEGFAFMNIGRFLERAILTADILDVKISDMGFSNDDSDDTTYWKYMLLSISGYELYLKTYRSGFEAKKVVEQIVLNNNFPRSILYSINRLHRYFEQLKTEGNSENYRKVDFLIGKIKSKVRYSTVDSIMQQGLHSYLKEVKSELYIIGNTLNQQFFAYS
ncbi:MAG: alpha-E domain-containing protein [Chitinophagaceae bacterium]|nr:alpha-E domain-containing protein [Chitinophagaceae bacterium]